MVDRTSNDNDVLNANGRPRGPDPYGEAAILLVESLIHGLIARSIISVADAVEIVGIAAEVKEDIAAERDAVATTDKSLAILSAICASLEMDLPSEEPRPSLPLSE